MNTPAIPATMLYGSLSIILLVLLGLNASRLRTSAGADEPPELYRASRAHGNMAEWLAAFIAMLLFIEIGGGSSLVAHILGGSFLVARIIYAYGRLSEVRAGSVIGATINYFVLLGGAGYGLFLRFAG